MVASCERAGRGSDGACDGCAQAECTRPRLAMEPALRAAARQDGCEREWAERHTAGKRAVCAEYGRALQQEGYFGKAFGWFATGDAEGSAQCALEIGRQHLRGIHVHQDVLEASKFFLKASARGDVPEARLLLAQANLRRGRDNAMWEGELRRLAATQRSRVGASAACVLAAHLISGGKQADWDAAWLAARSQFGAFETPDVALLIGTMIESGVGPPIADVRERIASARAWFKRSVRLSLRRLEESKMLHVTPFVLASGVFHTARLEFALADPTQLPDKNLIDMLDFVTQHDLSGAESAHAETMRQFRAMQSQSTLLAAHLRLAQARAACGEDWARSVEVLKTLEPVRELAASDNDDARVVLAASACVGIGSECRLEAGRALLLPAAERRHAGALTLAALLTMERHADIPFVGRGGLVRHWLNVAADEKRDPMAVRLRRAVLL